MIERSLLPYGIDCLIKCCTPLCRHMHPGRRMKDDTRFSRWQTLTERGTDSNRVASNNGRGIERHALKCCGEQVCLMLILWPHECPEPEPFLGVGHIHRVKIDADATHDWRQIVEVRWWLLPSPLRFDGDFRVPLPKHTAPDDVTVPVKVKMNAGGGPDLDQMHWLLAPP